MENTTIYSGPGKLYLNMKGLWPNAEQGQISMTVESQNDEVAAALQGRIDETQGNVEVKIRTDPFDNWGLLATLYPAAITTPAPGTRFANSGNTVKIWSPDERLVTVENIFVSKHPELHLGVGVPLYRGLELTGVIADATELGTTASLYAVTTGASDPGGSFALTDFIREAWTGAWGTVPGFGGDDASTLQAEDEWVISFDVKYKPLAVQKLVRAYELSSVAIMAKCRPVGPSQTQINAALNLQAASGGRLLGSRLGSTGANLSTYGALTLTSAISGKTITLENASLRSVGFDWGGTKLANGEIAFVTGMTFTTGAIQPLITFSA